MSNTTKLKARDARAVYKAKKPQENDYLVRDSVGLFLLIKKNGKKEWLFNYNRGGKQTSTFLGTFPEVGVSTARKKAALSRKLHHARNDRSTIPMLTY